MNQQHTFIRDKQSGALINTGEQELQDFKAKRKQIKELAALKEDVKFLKEQLRQLRCIVDQLTGNK
jgi:hypothetical protein